jgi:hypothetical protein
LLLSAIGVLQHDLDINVDTIDKSAAIFRATGKSPQ